MGHVDRDLPAVQCARADKYTGNLAELKGNYNFFFHSPLKELKLHKNHESSPAIPFSSLTLTAETALEVSTCEYAGMSLLP